MADNTIKQINVEQAKNPTTKRVIAIQYDRNGRYLERLFVRVEDNRGAAYENGCRYEAGLSYLLNNHISYDKYSRSRLFDPDSNVPKAYAIPDGMRLFRWVLKDGTVVTCDTNFPQVDSVVLRTLDGLNMFVPVSNVAYVVELRD